MAAAQGKLAGEWRWPPQQFWLGARRTSKGFLDVHVATHAFTMRVDTAILSRLAVTQRVHLRYPASW